MQATVLAQHEKHMLNQTTNQEYAAESQLDSHEATQQESDNTDRVNGKEHARKVRMIPASLPAARGSKVPVAVLVDGRESVTVFTDHQGDGLYVFAPELSREGTAGVYLQLLPARTFSVNSYDLMSIRGRNNARDYIRRKVECLPTIRPSW